MKAGFTPIYYPANSAEEAAVPVGAFVVLSGETEIKQKTSLGIGALGGGAIKNNFVATTAPTINDDSGDGYAVGSRWIDIDNNESYICVDNSFGGAVWEKTTVGTISEIANLQSSLDAKASTTNLTTHTGNTSNPHSVTKSQVGLGSVDNTADSAKPISTAQQTALDGKEPVVSTAWTAYTPTITTESGAWSNYTITAVYRVIHKMLEVSFKVKFTGTPSTASGMLISIPSGFTIDADALKGGAGWDTDPAGFAIMGDSGTVSGVPGIVNTRTTTKITVKYNNAVAGYISASGLTNTTPWTWTTNDDVVGRFTVPII